MTFETPNLSLPYIAPAQAQKHVTHNEAIRGLDALVQMSVLDNTLTTPPPTPNDGERYIIASSATDAWAGKDHQIAAYQDGAWAYFIAQIGWRAWCVSDESLLVFTASNWQTINANSGEELDQLGINASADTTNKLVVKSEAILFDNIGSNQQLKLNKSASADTASLLFQTGYAGHAEMGLAGDDHFHIKVSPDGSTFNEGLVVKNTGNVQFPHGANAELLTSCVTDAGGTTSVYGPPNMFTVAIDRATLTLLADRLYFCPFYVDRPTFLKGGFITLYTASTTPGAVLRAGVYHMGAASGQSWDVGDLVADYGTLPADSAGHKNFTLASDILLQPGWYLNTIGTDGSGAKLRYAKWMTPGLYNYVQFGTGTSADIRVSGPARYLYETSQNTAITTGLPSVFTDNPVIDTLSTDFTTCQMMIPHWERWI